MLKMRLELTDEFEVLVAEDGEKGCKVAAAEQPDLILMDLEMPVVDRWEATRRLKGNPQTRDMPVIGLSAHALAGEREKALAAGCEDFRAVAIKRVGLTATRLRRWGTPPRASTSSIQTERPRPGRPTCRHHAPGEVKTF